MDLSPLLSRLIHLADSEWESVCFWYSISCPSTHWKWLRWDMLLIFIQTGSCFCLTIRDAWLLIDFSSSGVLYLELMFSRNRTRIACVLDQSCLESCYCISLWFHVIVSTKFNSQALSPHFNTLFITESAGNQYSLLAYCIHTLTICDSAFCCPNYIKWTRYDIEWIRRMVFANVAFKLLMSERSMIAWTG